MASAIQLHPVDSSNIRAIGWQAGRLVVQFNNGGTYEYAGVSEQVYQSFAQSSSKGSFFSQNIRAQYQSQKVE